LSTLQLVTEESGVDTPDTDDQLAARREELVAEQEQLATQLDDLHVGDPTAVHDENFADSGQVAAEQGESMALASKLREQLDDVQRALDKLDAGSYGTCETCGEAINPDRLEAMPAARYCITHAG
jgi:RNA polymerase-binding transcription factor DksA